jgi:hypothetical protein
MKYKISKSRKVGKHKEGWEEEGKKNKKRLGGGGR